MSHLPSATDSIDGHEWDSSLEVRLPSIDADYEWLGYEAVHPLTWVPGSVAALATSPAA